MIKIREEGGWNSTAGFGDEYCGDGDDPSSILELTSWKIVPFNF
jgi:hypothetical protein